MAGSDNLYSRAVVAAKIVLPLIALGLLSALFLLARPAPQGEPVEPGTATEQDLAREQRLSAPSYTGVTSDGAEVALAAESLRPLEDPPGAVEGLGMVATITTAGGFGYTLNAPQGVIDEATGLTRLSGGVTIVTTDGYRLTAPRLSVRTDMTRLETEGGVLADGPMGAIAADRMVLTGDPEEGREGLLTFEGNVGLTYDPAR